jgi:hypothetical protein
VKSSLTAVSGFFLAMLSSAHAALPANSNAATIAAVEAKGRNCLRTAPNMQYS